MRLLIVAIGLAYIVVACTRAEVGDQASRAAQTAKKAGANAVDVVGGEDVEIQNYTFKPQTIDAKVGAEVTWTNLDGFGHTVTADNSSFDSKTIDVRQSFSFRFTQAGEYAYHCSIHGAARMSGVVRVL